MTRVLGASLTLCCAAPLLHAEDVDADGMGDAWEVQYWGNTDATPSADPDGDGVSNVVEFQDVLIRFRPTSRQKRQAKPRPPMCVIRSYLSTIRKQGLNLIDSIKAAFAGKPVSLTT